MPYTEVTLDPTQMGSTHWDPNFLWRTFSSPWLWPAFLLFLCNSGVFLNPVSEVA